VLLGDTPYIDSTRLATARAAHRAFLQTPSLAAAVREIPLWSTWDDHDFGKNGANGLLRGKDGPRRAYLEYRAQARYGHDGQGIYTRVRYGPVDLFLLDARWFAGTEPSPADPKQPTCLGRRQWAWLLGALRASTAPFKVLANGMIWHAKGGKDTDDWATYFAERDALFAWIQAEGITGCLLVGGDIHASQHLVHPPPAGGGYPLHEMIVSPLHDGVLPALDRDHPHKTWSAAEKHVFLLLDANTKASVPALTASWIRADGKVLHKARLRPKDLGAE
jgi:alkaline phosphatase D